MVMDQRDYRVDPDDPTSDVRKKEPEREKGTIVEFGLTTGQTYRALTQRPVGYEMESMIIDAANGETWAVRERFVTFTVSYEVDMPTDAEVEDYKAKLMARPDNPVSADEIRAKLGIPPQTGAYI